MNTLFFIIMIIFLFIGIANLITLSKDTSLEVVLLRFMQDLGHVDKELVRVSSL